MTHSQRMRMFIKRLTVFMRITTVAAVIVFALSVTTLRMLNLKIGLDMQKLNEKKQKFMDEIVPKWIDEAKKNGKVVI